MKSFILLLSIVYIDAINVAITVDDGWAEHLSMAQELHSRGLHGTFYINSGRVNESSRLTLDQLRSMEQMGHEIGGHTLLHQSLATQNYNTQKTNICDDRNRLLEWGFKTTTFAFPFGVDTPESFELISLCGYNGARDSGGIRTNDSCTSCPKSENIPPANPLQIRSVSYRLSMGLQGLKWYISQADADPEYSNGLLVFIFHEYGIYPTKDGSILPSDFTQFLDWMVAYNISVVTVDSTINKKVYPNFDTLPATTLIGKPYIALTFEDGTIDHFTVVKPLLEQYDARGTFFLNSGTIGASGYVSTSQIKQLQSSGHEIGGNSVNQNERLLPLDPATQLLRIQTDYNTLVKLKLNVTSFAWPYGETSSSLLQAVQTVGYKRARDVGGIRIPTSCSLCPSTLKLPLSLSDKYEFRSFNVKSYHTFGDLMWQVFRAEDWAISNPNDTSILVFSFQTVCTGCAFSPTKLRDFLSWLKPRHKIGTGNELINNVI
jgi:peptidoglycan/xylan/chitin deacetylase (PgdA/CDA1 family)